MCIQCTAYIKMLILQVFMHFNTTSVSKVTIKDAIEA